MFVFVSNDALSVRELVLKKNWWILRIDSIPKSQPRSRFTVLEIAHEF